MSEFSSREVEEIVKAMQEPCGDPSQKIPLRDVVKRVEFSPLQDEAQGERGDFSALKVEIEVVFGTTTIALKELLELRQGAVLGLDQEENLMVEIVANGKRIGRGEIVASDGRFGVRVLAI